MALLVEGLLLIAIAFAAERISRRVGASPSDDDTGDPEPPPTDEEIEPAPEPTPGPEPASG